MKYEAQQEIAAKIRRKAGKTSQMEHFPFFRHELNDSVPSNCLAPQCQFAKQISSERKMWWKENLLLVENQQTLVQSIVANATATAIPPHEYWFACIVDISFYLCVYLLLLSSSKLLALIYYDRIIRYFCIGSIDGIIFLYNTDTWYEFV